MRIEKREKISGDRKYFSIKYRALRAIVQYSPLDNWLIYIDSCRSQINSDEFYNNA